MPKLLGDHLQLGTMSGPHDETTDEGDGDEDVTVSDADSEPVSETDSPQHRGRTDNDLADETVRSMDENPANDPVQEAFEGKVDLYDIATWEKRSGLDNFAAGFVDFFGGNKRVILLAVALTLFLGQVALVGLFVLQAPLLGVLSLLSLVPALFFVVFIWSSDPTRREPVTLLAVTFVLSVLFASFAAVVNSTLLPGFEVIPVLGLPLFYFLVVGPIEEFVKWLAVRVYAFRSGDFGTVVDGVVYGAVAGLGFAAIENLIYIVFFSVTVTPVETIIEQQYAIATAVTRSFVGPGHVIFSAWAGFYLGLAKFNPQHRGPIVVKGLLIAAVIHATYNTVVTLVPLNAIGFLGFILSFHVFWFLLLYRKVRKYRDLYAVAGGVVGPRHPDRPG